MNKFNKLYNIILQDINSTRKPIRKVNAMTPVQFIAFLKQFLPYVKNGKVQLDDIRITQKVDGCAISLIWDQQQKQMKFQSSYSGVTSYKNLPFPVAGKFLYQTYQLVFRDIGQKFGSFKIKGELIWINQMQQGGKVTPIGASYLTEKFGSSGGIVVFQIYKITNDGLQRFTAQQQNQLMQMIIDMNNDEFAFYLAKDIILNQNVNFTIDPTELLAIIQRPQYNKSKFTEEDGQILQQLKKIQDDVVQQLSNIIDNSRGAFSAQGDLIQGIVLKINNSGNQYGVFSNGYKDMKKLYWQQFEKVKPVYMQFMKKVFGYSMPKFIKLHWDQIDKVRSQAILDQIKQQYVNRLETILNNINDSTVIPTGAKRTQIAMGGRMLDTVKNLNRIQDFQQQFIK